jgi:hypothetical protein
VRRLIHTKGRIDVLSTVVSIYATCLNIKKHLHFNFPSQCIYGCMIPKIDSDCFVQQNEEIGVRNWCAVQCVFCDMELIHKCNLD